jgi:hypothetical protein
MGNNVCHEEIRSEKGDFEFLHTEVPEIDEYFSRVSKMFSEFEGYRIKLQEKLQKAHQLAGTNKLKEPTMVDPFKVMLWSFSAATNGDIKSILDYSTATRVALKFKRSASIPEEAWKLYEAVDEIMSIYHETIEESPRMNQRIENLLLEMSELKKFIYVKNYTMKNHVSRRDFDKVVEKNELAYIAMNKALIEWNNLHLKVGKQYRAILQGLDQHLEEADKIGAKANDQGLKTPQEIFEAFHEGQKIEN